MKVLFAVNNDNISDAIIKKYQKVYKEIISYKNVYYFNAILKELQNDKSYDRVVISEDLEPFANNNYDTIDKFLFEKLDKISDEATKSNGEDINIILICSDRRNKSDDMLTRIFGIGIYNALIGEERNIDNLCKLMNQPRTKKEAKIAYKIDGTSIGYQAEDENNVSEAEVQNILAHYKRLGKDEDKYVDSFNNIVSQYTDSQLKIIIRYLPLNVKAVLEERSPKYQELTSFSANNGRVSKTPYTPRTAPTTKKEEKIKVKMLQEEKDNISKPIVIPSALNNKKTIISKPKETENTKMTKTVPTLAEEAEQALSEVEEIKEEVVQEEKRKRGRPRKNPEIVEQNEKPKRGRGRPKKVVEDTFENDEEDDEEEFDLFNMDSEENNEINNQVQEIEDDTDDIDLFSLDELNDEANEDENEDQEQDDEDVNLFDLDDEENTELEEHEENEEVEEEENVEEFEEDEENGEDGEDVDLFNMDEEPEYQPVEQEPLSYEKPIINEEPEYKEEQKTIININQPTNNGGLGTVLTKDKKIVTFVGTTKNGTSFIVNNLALSLASMNISTAILDATQSKNAYYIFTKNEQSLRDIAEDSITNLSNGVARGIEVNKNLTVYTELPGKEPENINVENILATLVEKHDVVLIDADFKTETEYFEKSQETYLIQSMDILTIQPLTAFLRNLKSKGILRQEKLKIIINKWEKVKSLSEKILIGGISSYNDPAMSYMTELFDKDKILYCKIPFEMQNYVKYLDSLVNCEVGLKGYTKQLTNALNQLAAMVYPLLNKQTYSPMGNKKERMEFSDSTQNILNKMKKNY